MRFAIIVLMMVVGVYAEADSIFIPVTYYDFRCDVDGSPFQNNSCRSRGVQQNLVASILVDGKPVASPFLFSDYPQDCYKSIGLWFVQNDSTDAIFYNHVIKDSIGFEEHDSWHTFYAKNYWGEVCVQVVETLYTDTGTFLLVSDSCEKVSEGFFPLDGRGFDSVDILYDDFYLNFHNYSFTMELKADFIYHPDQFFEIAGDDDIWVFIDDSLVIDLGGVRRSESKRFELRDYPDLILGDTCELAIFFAERMSRGSELIINTDVFIEKMITPTNHRVPKFKREASTVQRIDLMGRSVGQVVPHKGMILEVKGSSTRKVLSWLPNLR